MGFLLSGCQFIQIKCSVNWARPNINTPNDILKVISHIFINNIKFRYKECCKLKKENGKLVEKPIGTYCERRKGSYIDQNCSYCKTDALEFIRLKEHPTQKFYSMFLDWKTKTASYSQMIFVIKRYWSSLTTVEKNFVYIGRTWGEEAKSYSDNYKGWKELYVNLNKKTASQVTNLAIVKIKEEQDFIDFKLMPYIEILNDLELIESNFYNKIKYGTDDKNMIAMLKEGFSIELAKAIKSGEYSEYISISNNILRVDDKIIDKMIENNENEIIIFELQYYIG